MLKKGMSNGEQWKRQYTAAGEQVNWGGFYLKSHNVVVPLSQAVALDNAAGDAKGEIENIIRTAKASGKIDGDYDHEETVKTTIQSRTPRTRAGESEKERKVRGDKEGKEFAMEELMQVLKEDERAYFMGLSYFLDSKTGKIESQEKRAIRFQLWNRYVEGTCRLENEDLIARTPNPGDFYFILSEVDRDQRHEGGHAGKRHDQVPDREDEEGGAAGHLR